MLDVAMWGIAKLRGQEHNLPVHIANNSGIYWLQDAKEVPDTQVLTYDFGDLLLVWEMHSFQNHHPIDGMEAGTAFYGSDGTLVVDGGGWKVFGNKDEVVASGKAAGGSHARNFLECIKSRQRPNADIEIGRLSTTICHLGNISCRLGRDVRFDPKTETFGDDHAASAYLTKEYRRPYTLPMV
jgi:hypothetical protein